MYADNLQEILEKRLTGIKFHECCTALAEICKDYGGKVITCEEADRNKIPTGRAGFWYFNDKVKDRKTKELTEIDFPCLFSKDEVGNANLIGLAKDISNGKA